MTFPEYNREVTFISTTQKSYPSDVTDGEWEFLVTTERIVLEDLDLGPFVIQLELHHLTESSPYTVTAVDPDESSAGHPHPHVSGQSLCEGDGKQAIATALANGLISEFFVLVRQILRTYNPGSAYRTLNEWHGVDCAACDATISSEDAYCCDTCHCSLCSDCEYRCDTRPVDPQTTH